MPVQSRTSSMSPARLEAVTRDGAVDGLARPRRLGAGVVTRAQAALDAVAAHALAVAAETGAPVPECFATIPEPRHSRGLRHPLPLVLTLCLAAVLSGETTVIGVAGWAAHPPQELLAGLGARREPADPDRFVAPSPDTVLRLLAALSARVVARQVCAWVAGRARRPPVEGPNRAERRAAARLATALGSPARQAIAVDGKTLRGAAGRDGIP
ncbi:transposase family protein, partial [Frankia sp. CiP3]|uniref:transposase family protein n=1 Tax=Frankia sp. CiP3 TaxID=2880971 RepID=UPI001EF63C9E